MHELKEEMKSMKEQMRGMDMDLRAEIQRHSKWLHTQAENNYALLERDLGVALDGFRWLDERKVEKEALRKAAL